MAAASPASSRASSPLAPVIDPVDDAALEALAAQTLPPEADKAAKVATPVLSGVKAGDPEGATQETRSIFACVLEPFSTAWKEYIAPGIDKVVAFVRNYFCCCFCPTRSHGIVLKFDCVEDAIEKSEEPTSKQEELRCAINLCQAAGVDKTTWWGKVKQEGTLKRDEGTKMGVICTWFTAHFAALIEMPSHDAFPRHLLSDEEAEKVRSALKTMDKKFRDFVLTQAADQTEVSDFNAWKREVMKNPETFKENLEYIYSGTSKYLLVTAVRIREIYAQREQPAHSSGPA